MWNAKKLVLEYKLDVFDVRFSNGKKNGQLSLAHLKKLCLYIKWSRLVNHSKTGQSRPFENWTCPDFGYPLYLDFKGVRVAQRSTRQARLLVACRSILCQLFAQDWPNLCWSRFNNVGQFNKFFTSYNTIAHMKNWVAKNSAAKNSFGRWVRCHLFQEYLRSVSRFLKAVLSGRDCV